MAPHRPLSYTKGKNNEDRNNSLHSLVHRLDCDIQDEPSKGKRGRIAMVSDARKRANEKYRKESVRQFAVRFYPADSDAWEHLREQPNKAGYIRR